MSVQSRANEILQIGEEGDKVSRCCDFFLAILITANVVAVVFESVEGIRLRLAPFLRAFEIASVVVFSVEYVMRVWSCVATPKFSGGWGGRLRYVLTPLAIIDLIAILPFYLPFVGIDLRSMRAFRLFRFIRLAKIGRYSSSLQLVGRVVRSRARELATTMFVTFVLLVVASCLMYFAETRAQPELFPHIPAAMWWGVATLTTVGYGDIYPVTVAGKLIAAVVAVVGIGMFAVPAGLLGGAFMEEVQRTRREPTVCPHCGEQIHPDGKRSCG